MDSTMKRFFSAFFTVSILLLCVSCGKKYKSLTTPELLAQSLQLAQEGKWDDSGNMASCVLEREPENIPALILAGLAFEADGKKELAVGCLEKAVKKSPGNFMAVHTLGRLLVSQKKYDAALPCLKKAYELDPSEMNNIVLLAEVMNNLKMSGAASYYALALKNPRFKNDPAPWNQLGLIFAGTASKSKALDFFIKAYKADAENHITVLNLAVFLDRYMNNTSKARPFYERYLRLTEKNPALGEKRAEIKKRLKELTGKSPQA